VKWLLILLLSGCTTVYVVEEGGKLERNTNIERKGIHTEKFGMHDRGTGTSDDE